MKVRWFEVRATNGNYIGVFPAKNISHAKKILESYKEIYECKKALMREIKDLETLAKFEEKSASQYISQVINEIQQNIVKISK